MRTAFLASCLLLSAGCDSATRPEETSGPVAIDPAVGDHHAGGQLAATFTNLSSQSLNFSLCFARFERQVKGGGWAVVYAEQGACAAVLIILNGFGSAKANIYLPAGLSSGTYRVRFPELGRPASAQGPVVEAAQIGGVFTLTP
jgi:hypothetical protein